MRSFIRVAVALATGLVAAPSVADRGEDIFRNALKYTVQIRSTVALPFSSDRKGSGLGAGFVVDAKRGWIMTNAHVVSRSPARIEIAFHGGEFAPGRRVYVDPFLDLAIVAPETESPALDVPAPRLECRNLPPVGHPVGAFGHPWRLPFTGTRGIISGVTARYRTELLQTDAPINQGNSGGPLISLEDGRIVGINTAGIRGAQNTNFAVAMKYACRVLELLQQDADPSPPDLRVVFFQDIDDRKELRVARNYGPAGSLPFQSGDLIREVTGTTGVIQNETQLVHALRGRLADASVKVMRGGESTPVSGGNPAAARVLEQRGVFASGVLFAPIHLRDAREINLPALMVHHVEAGSIAQAQEFAQSDVLEAVDGAPVQDLEALHALLAAAQAANRRVRFTLRRIAGTESMFGYVERNLPVRGVRYVGEGLGPPTRP